MQEENLRMPGWRSALQKITCGAASRAFPQIPHASWVHAHVEADAAAQEAAAARFALRPGVLDAEALQS